ncbi:TPA: DNA circularization protein [Yersinia enterocolitica]|nr:DNA circularization protein [Yersinia enterocolitica]HDL6626128.1 DNA circularization protein [Yersinia enterocolitica]HDL6904054.1 DNA circularization protein [Yersinia enterocolitica]HDL6908658.1 DNA circularization protein [Yersinia enterocolitica]HDL7027036.1 DNA circularization protein [Yersinia enterocolitica]
MSLISNALSDLLGTGGDSWQWSEHLHPASFRGVPFAVMTAEGVFGRRQAIHEYPYRNTAWIEDLGRATRRLTIRGFLIQSSGLYTAPDVMTQRDSLIAACEMPDAGTLVHPTLGEMTVSIPESGLRLNEGAESGRVFEFTLTIIESGLRVFSITSSADAVSSIQSSWFGLATKSVATFIATVKGEIRSVTQTIRTLKNTAAFWVNMVNSTTSEATNLGNVLRSTLGRDRYGRYNHGTVGGSVSGATTSVSTQSDTTNLSALVAQKMAVSVEGRASLVAATDALTEAATVEGHANAALAVVNAILSSGASTLDLIRMMQELTSINDDTFRPNPSDNSTAEASYQLIIVLCAGAMVFAASQYQPESYDDAVDILTRVCDVVDDAALSAADSGNDEVYQALMELRGSIVTLLQQTGANLSRVDIVNFNRSLPALNLANRLYQDARRGDALVKMAAPVHPAFMPIRFKALNS